MICTPAAVLLSLLSTISSEEPEPEPLILPLSEPQALLLPEPADVPEEEPAPLYELWLPSLIPQDEPPPALYADNDEDLEADEPLPPRSRHGRRRHHRSMQRSQIDSHCGTVHPTWSFTILGHVFTPQWIDRTLHGVIANRCRSKTYRDILALDGGTVGISHFAVGSLFTLYSQMPLRRYFGAHARRIPERPYRHAWWRLGMRRFLRSGESRKVQLRAWRIYIRPALSQALAHHWTTDRELAIAASVANSLGAYGFRNLAEDSSWRPERTLENYARLSDHKERRRQRLNREFPVSGHASN